MRRQSQVACPEQGSKHRWNTVSAPVMPNIRLVAAGTAARLIASPCPSARSLAASNAFRPVESQNDMP
jgi:hypothetical protein